VGAVAHPTQQTVQPAARIRETRSRGRKAQQGGLGLDEVVVDDDRRDGAVEVFLVAVAARPGARGLAGPGEIVVQKQADSPTSIGDLSNPHIRVVGRQIGALGEDDTERGACVSHARPGAAQQARQR
jgi:hypothetical protein